MEFLQLSPSSRYDADRDDAFQILWEEGERVFGRRWRQGSADEQESVLTVAEHPTPASLDRLTHECALRDELEGGWAVLPLALTRENGRTVLVLEDPGGEPLASQLGTPMEVGRFLRLAIGIAAAVGKLHRHGLVHKDLKPANIVVDCADGGVRLTGFGLASRLPRERQAPDPPEFIAGTLAYMAPEQTGRMNRSIDARSDLYALGVTYYQMVAGSLPFTASDPMEWVHCHIARKPMPPAERSRHVPIPVSDIIMKLLAKMAEERYQTAAGLERDLRHCFAEWEARGYIDDFPSGQQDTPDRLLIPEKLYGRERDVETLLAAFDRIVKSGTPELVLVSGFAGIGKSSVVHELHKALVPLRGLFAVGKFDQYKRDIPYATLAQALQSLVRQLLAKSDSELSGWRGAMLQVLGPNGQLLVDLIPELKLIIGEQPPVPELSPQDAQRRFHLVFRRFIGVFAQPDHPLALFLDDLQWLDPATLDVLEDLLTQPDLRHLLMIGAYRDNEVDTAHPLTRRLASIRGEGGRVAEMTLAPLGQNHVGGLIAHALHCTPHQAAPLTQLVHEKTAGNPFFVIQFLHTLAESRLLVFDHATGRWSWDLERIRAEGYTDNVVDLIVGKLTRLPAETQKALQILACLGNVAEIPMVSVVLGLSAEQVQAALWEAVRQEQVETLDGAYRFVHDRVQEAAYSLIPDASRAATHLRIGRLLATRTPPEQREEVIFEIVNQLNRGAALITDTKERDQVAAFNLMAGKRAKASTANVSALAYLITGTTLLAEDCWERRRDLVFALELERAECEFLTGALAEADQRLIALSTRAAQTVERANVASLRIDLYTTLDQSSRAIAVGLDHLRHLGMDWSPHPTEEEVRREYDRIWSQLGSRTIEQLVDLPLMRDPTSVATLEFLTKIAPPAFYTDANLLALVVCRGVNLSLERGNCDASCAAYAFLGMIAGPRFGDYQAGFRFGRVGYDLVEERGLIRFQARVYNDFGNLVMPWTTHVRASRDMVRRTFEAANMTGDLTYAAYCGNILNTKLLMAGDPLAEVEREAEHGLAFAQRARFGLVIERIVSQLGLIRTLRGLTPAFGSFDDAHFDESRMERRLAANPDLALAEFFYWTRKLQARFFAGDYATAIETSSKAQRLLWSAVSHLETAEYHFYAALSRTAACDAPAVGERQQHMDAVAAHHRQLQIWAVSCPENFENRAALVGAEIARLEGRELDAARLYEEGIRSAHANGFVHNEALANELAARFYAARGFNKIGLTYLRDARYLYLRWGADGKVRQLAQFHPQLSESEAAPGPTHTIGARVEHLDLATVLKVSQAVSGEIVLENLLNTLMRTAIEQAGAERGLLLLPHEAGQRIAAEATTHGDTIRVDLRDQPAVSEALPEAIVQTVIRTQAAMILDDATADRAFAADSYIRRRKARSILCVPLINQSKLIGMLYLENNLAPGVFTPARISVLRLIASQAAIALENTRLYQDLAEREAKIRRLVDANIIGIFMWEYDGPILEANDAFLRIVGYDREDLAAGRLRWTELTPAEWLNEHEQRWTPEIRLTGNVQPYEKEYFRKDGSRVPVLVGASSFDETRSRGVSFVLDMTERKRAEAEARENEQRYREVQAELAHGNRVATMGQLTASIAHEVNQPLSATVTNAQAGRRWLERQPPDLNEARQAFDRIIREGTRAAEVIERTRALITKAPFRTEPVDINQAIREVVELTHAEALKQGVAMHMQLADRLPLVGGDRVQLQQVVLNLVVNAIQALGAAALGTREVLVATGQAEEGDVAVAVIDSGPGLDPVKLAHIFAPFFTTKPSGLGMGLSICRAIVEAHGGRLWAEKNQPEGTIFQFTLPIEPDNAL